jgi:hypothetical protein
MMSPDGRLPVVLHWLQISLHISLQVSPKTIRLFCDNCLIFSWLSNFSPAGGQPFR